MWLVWKHNQVAAISTGVSNQALEIAHISFAVCCVNPKCVRRLSDVMWLKLGQTLLWYQFD